MRPSLVLVVLIAIWSWALGPGCSENPTRQRCGDGSCGGDACSSCPADVGVRDLGGKDVSGTELGAKDLGPEAADASNKVDAVIANGCAGGPLAGLPSAPGPHLATINALGDNQWLDLGAPAADPTWGRAGGRSWGAKALVNAPGLGGAFFFGEGPHAFVKPNGYADDDLWFYDVNGNRWICVYPGNNPMTFTQRVKAGELLIDGNGQLVDSTGQPIPVHTLIHAWGYLSYDPDLGRFAFLAGNGLGRYYMPGEQDMNEGLTLLEQQLQGKPQPLMSPWFYDIGTCRFDRYPATGSMGSANSYDFPQVLYIGSLKQFLVLGSSGVAAFDPAKKEWTSLSTSGTGPTGYDCGGCYDSKRGRVYHLAPNGFLAYQIATQAWSALGAQGTPPSSSGTNSAYFEYDPLHDLVVAMQFSPSDGAGVYAYDPNANSWSGPAALPADVVAKLNSYGSANVSFDPALNAFFVHIAMDGEPNGNMWAYRYKK